VLRRTAVITDSNNADTAGSNILPNLIKGGKDYHE